MVAPLGVVPPEAEEPPPEAEEPPPEAEAPDGSAAAEGVTRGEFDSVELNVAAAGEFDSIELNEAAAALLAEAALEAVIALVRDELGESDDEIDADGDDPDKDADALNVAVFDGDKPAARLFVGVALDVMAAEVEAAAPSEGEAVGVRLALAPVVREAVELAVCAAARGRASHATASASNRSIAHAKRAGDVLAG